MKVQPEPWRPRVEMWGYDAGAVALVLLVGGFFGFMGLRGGMIPTFPRLPHVGIPQGFPGPPHEMRQPDAGPYVWFHLLLLLSAGILLVRRRWPAVACAVTFGAFLGVVYLGPPPVGPAVALVIAVFGLANRTGQKVALIVGSAITLAIGLLSFAANSWKSPEPVLVQAAAAVAIAAALGDSTRSRREYVNAISRRAEHAEQTREAEAQRRVADERLRIARDLHDTVAHEISVISLNAGVASSALASHPERAQQALATIRSASRGALTEIGELLHYLRAEEAAETAPPRPILESLPELLHHLEIGGLRVTMDVTGDLADVTGGTGVVVYRIVQEGLTNAHKHGTGNWAHVALTIGDSVRVRVENPMKNDDVVADPTGHGWGLVGIRERVSSLGGAVSAGPDGGVWVLDVRLPLRKGQGE